MTFLCWFPSIWNRDIQIILSICSCLHLFFNEVLTMFKSPCKVGLGEGNVSFMIARTLPVYQTTPKTKQCYAPVRYPIRILDLISEVLFSKEFMQIILRGMRGREIAERIWNMHVASLKFVNYNALYENFKITFKFILLLKPRLKNLSQVWGKITGWLARDTYRTYLGMCFLTRHF